jgi:hypothetical protein
MIYGVQLVKDDELAQGQEWILLEEPGRLILFIGASSFCSRVVAEGMAAVGNALARHGVVVAA